MADKETAKKRAMYLLGGRDYSKAELTEKLRKSYGEKIAAETAELMCEYGYVDDKRYAVKLAKKCIEANGYGKSRAMQIMKQKGVPREIAEEALSAYSKEDISAEIVSIIRKKYIDRLSIPGLEGRKETQKVIAALARRGYGYGDIKSAFETVREELDDETASMLDAAEDYDED